MASSGAKRYRPRKLGRIIRMRPLTLSALLVLASCSGGGSDESREKATERTAQAPTQAVSLEPGEWEFATNITKSYVANRQATVVGAKSNSLPSAPQSSTTKACIGPDQVEQPREALFTGEREGCKYEHFYMSRGRLVAALSCPQPNGEMNMSMDGSYTATTMDVSADTSIGVFGTGTLKVQSKISGRRTGPCPAGA
jgi:hypothetical protein